MIFRKYQALGNDYIVLDAADWQLPSAKQIQRLCDRHFGLGSDGILWGPLWPRSEDFTELAARMSGWGEESGKKELCGMRIFNPDGTEAEKSGNGLRIFSRFLFDCGWLFERPVRLLTLGGSVGVQVRDGGKKVRVEMGRVDFRADRIPVAGVEGEVIERRLSSGGCEFVYSSATIGNPHCVIVVEDEQVSLPDLARRFGPGIEVHPRFPNRVNVQFMRIRDRQNLEIAIWERGAGYTLASGSSASACAAVARRLGLADDRMALRSEGGAVKVEVDENFNVAMEGGVASVAEGKFSPEVFTWPD